jgi:hypothetical protein
MGFFTTKGNTLFIGQTIKSFLGQKQEDIANILNMPLGQLIYNKNFEYKYSGDKVYLKTKRGSTLIKDISNRVYGASNYIYNLTTDYFVWVDSDGILKYYNEDSDAIFSLTTGINIAENYFVMFGLGTASALYGCNATDKVYKVSGSTPTYSAIADSPGIDYLCFSALSKRLFGIKKHEIYYTEVQVSSTSTANLEDWGWGGASFDNSAIVSPDSGAGFNSIIDDGQSMFFFKDTGIWILPNPNEATTNWEFPKANADIGTLSPKTVKLARYGQLEGIIYLGADKTLRFFNANVIRNAGTLPTIEGGDSRIISKNFQNILDAIPDGKMSTATAEYWNSYYVLNITSENGSDLDTTIIIDTEKILQEGDTDIPQPFWFLSENMNYSHFVKRSSNNRFYGFNIQGFISRLFIENKYVEDVPARVDSSESLAIKASAYTGWWKYSDNLIEFKKVYVYWAAIGKWNLNFVINSFRKGEAIPDFSNGIESALKPQHVSGSYFYDVDLFDIARYSSSKGILSQNGNIEIKGNYFLFGFYNNNKNEPVSIYGVEPIFKISRKEPISFR